jgi:hypothetical protein
MTRYGLLLALSFSVAAFPLFAAKTGPASGSPGLNPSLYKSVSAKRLVETGRDHQWSITFKRQSGIDTIHIIAVRVEFQHDTSTLTTGDGSFSLRRETNSREYNRYVKGQYKYDNLPHDSSYFASQLAATAGYYSKVSRGRLVLRSTIYPQTYKDSGYALPKPMTYYSFAKKAKETYSQYYDRLNKGYMQFVRDAIKAADTSLDSPFAKLHFNPADSTFRDESGQKAVILLVHAGSSGLTDGGQNGPAARDSPSDMIDYFIDRPMFKMLKDSLKLKTIGVPVKGAADTLVIDEVMMCSETSNQDSLNWGIQGILVNQVARQLGIPDLWSTSSGVSGVGAFCIMDFAGYSAGDGFIPPYPSAWVRAFMGWDEVKVAPIGATASYRVKALTSVLDRDSLHRDVNSADTTILLVPINNHEYYLVENRQRNLAGKDSLFKYDTADIYKVKTRVIAGYPYNVNIDSNVVGTSPKSKVVLQVRNNDVSLPASGALVWHVDEYVLRDRLGHNMVNADSSYRGVGLLEADGVPDIGITFLDVLSQQAFDYGGAEDVFPHYTKKKTLRGDDTSFTVTGFGPYTAPSSRSNDGGNTYLHLDIRNGSSSPREELTAVREYQVVDFSDSTIIVSPSWDYQVPGWPKTVAPESFFEPCLADLDLAHPGKELVLLGKSGRLYAWSTDSGVTGNVTYGNRKVAIDRIGVRGDTVKGADTAFCLDTVPGAAAIPSVIDKRVFIPSRSGCIKALSSIGPSGAHWDSVALGGIPSTYVCRYRSDSSWVVGCEHGRIVFGKGLDTAGAIPLGSDSAVCAVAALREKPTTVAVIQSDGRLSLCSENGTKPDTTVKVPGLPPYTLVTGDLDRDNASEIVVCDSRHGIWVYKQSLTLAPGWEARPSDWPSAYVDTAAFNAGVKDRSKWTFNPSPPALADINRDGRLDILVGGTNGLYAFNYKGVLIGGWPSYLDNRFWYQRGSILASPIVVTGANREPLVLFSSPTGQNATFRIAKITKADKTKGMVWFLGESGAPDSMGGLSKPLIDTLLTMGDSLVPPYVTPGGFVDAVKANGKRPLMTGSLLPAGTTSTLMSSWPLSTGSSMTASPLAGFTNGASSPDLFAVSTAGWVYRWKLGREIMPDSLFWPEIGFDGGRSFAYGGGTLPEVVKDREPIYFHSYPNPTAGLRMITFKYKFSGPASNVRLDIFTFTGFSVFSTSAMGAPPQLLTGSYPDWNELHVPIDKLGPSVYRCRLEATIGGKKYEKFWKLAVTR